MITHILIRINDCKLCQRLTIEWRHIHTQNEFKKRLLFISNWQCFLILLVLSLICHFLVNRWPFHHTHSIEIRAQRCQFLRKSTHFCCALRTFICAILPQNTGESKYLLFTKLKVGNFHICLIHDDFNCVDDFRVFDGIFVSRMTFLRKMFGEKESTLVEKQLLKNWEMNSLNDFD